MSLKKIIASLPTRDAAARARMRARAEERRETGSDAQVAEAKALIAALDALEESERTDIRARPLADRVAEAFTRHLPSETEIRILRALLENPGSTSTDLTGTLGWGGQSWHLHFGTMCQAREPWLWPAEPFSDKSDRKFWSGILAEFDAGARTFTMRAEAVDGLRAAGIAA